MYRLYQWSTMPFGAVLQQAIFSIDWLPFFVVNGAIIGETNVWDALASLWELTTGDTLDVEMQLIWGAVHRVPYRGPLLTTSRHH